MSILLQYQQALRNCQQELRKCQNESVQSGEQIVALNKRIEDEKKSRQSCQRKITKNMQERWETLINRKENASNVITILYGYLYSSE